jgi:hypothetical protein
MSKPRRRELINGRDTTGGFDLRNSTQGKVLDGVQSGLRGWVGLLLQTAEQGGSNLFDFQE